MWVGARQRPQLRIQLNCAAAAKQSIAAPGSAPAAALHGCAALPSRSLQRRRCRRSPSSIFTAACVTPTRASAASAATGVHCIQGAGGVWGGGPGHTARRGSRGSHLLGWGAATARANSSMVTDSGSWHRPPSAARMPRHADQPAPQLQAAAHLSTSHVGWLRGKMHGLRVGASASRHAPSPDLAARVCLKRLQRRRGCGVGARAVLGCACAPLFRLGPPTLLQRP